MAGSATHPRYARSAESCDEHCLSGGAGKCVDAHDDWLRGGSGGLVEVFGSVTPRGRRPFGPERTLGMKGAVLEVQKALAEENGLQRCARCRGLEDPARPHRHG